MAGGFRGPQRDDSAACIVVEGASDAARAAAFLEIAGWSGPIAAGGTVIGAVGPRFSIVDPRPGSEGAGSGSDAVWARIAGRATVVVAPVPGSPLVGDLARLGPVVDWRADAVGPAHPADGLVPDQWSLLLHLARGASVARAAAEVHLSLRTAHRRIADARNRLGGLSVAAAGLLVRERVAALAPGGSGLRAFPLIGREAELAALASAAAPGRPVRVVCASGMGRSAFLHAAASAGDARTGGLEVTGAEPVALARLLGRSAVASGDADVLAATLTARFRGGRIIIDDAELVDDLTWDVLAQVRDAASVVVGTRLVETDGSVPSWVEEAATIELGPLTPADVTELLRGRAPLSSRRDAEEVAALGRGAPAVVLDLAGRRGALDQHVAGAAAALAGGPAGLAAQRVGLAFAEVPVTAFSDGEVDALLASGLVRSRGRGLEPVGRRSGAAMVGDPGDEERTAIHRWLASAVTDPLAAAEHRLAADRDEPAREQVQDLLAAERDPSRRAHAHVLLARTAPAHDRALAMSRASRSIVIADEPAESLRVMQELVADDPTLLADARVLGILAGLLVNSGDVAGAVDLADRALERAELTPTDEIALRMMRGGVRLAAGLDATGIAGTAAAIGSETDRVDEGGGRSDVDGGEAAGLDRDGAGDGDGEDLVVRLMPGVMQALNGDPAWPSILFPVFEDALRQAGDRPGLSEPLVAYLAEVLVFLVGAYGDLHDASVVADRAVERLDQVGAPGLADQIRLLSSFVRLSALGPSDERIDELVVRLASTGANHLTTAAWSVLVVAYADRGRIDAAREVLATALAAPTDPMGADGTMRARAELDFATGEDEAVLTRAVSSAGAGSFLPTASQLAGVQYLAMLALGRLEEVPVPASVFPVAAWVSRVAAAVRASLTGDHVTAVAEARAAVTCVGTPWRDHLPLRWMLGEVLARAGLADEAEVVLRSVETEATEEGLLPLAARTRASLRAHGAASRGSSGLRLVGLSARETEVMLLVGAGLTSVQIADRLHLQRSTVETVITRSRQKLGAPNRRAAAAIVIAAVPAEDASGPSRPI